MKTVKLSALAPGIVFCYAEREFVILEHLPEGGTLVLQHQTDTSLPFNDRKTEDRNDFRNSSIKEYLNGEYLEELMDCGADESAILDLTIDLKATDGTHAYGTDTVKVGLLTLEQYGKYKDIIPLNENDWWWLATPWATRWLRSPYTYGTASAWRVYTDGTYYNNYCSSSRGSRPALRLSSDLLVSLDVCEDDECFVEQKTEAWTEYLKYLAAWAIDHADAGHYGASPSCFGEWVVDEYEQEDADEE